MTQNFVEKYRAKTYEDFIGQDTAIKELETFLSEFPKRKAILLYGSPGTGKTSLAWAAARKRNLEVLELNSSDLRNRLKLEETLKPAAQQAPLFKKGKILLMDEIDGVTGTDIGGVAELVRVIEKTAHPLILTGNDVWQTKFSDLRPKCKMVEMKSLKTEDITKYLKKVLEKEGITENEHFLRQIAIKSQGDVRAALNDLHAYTADKTSIIDIDEKRDREESIFNILKILFQERQDFLNIFDNTEMSLDEILLWLEENIPKEYSGKALAHAFHALSNADKFRGRIYRQQHWRFLLYQNVFQTAGISYAKDKPKSGFVKYERPKRILKIWLNNQKTQKKKTIVQKMAKYSHYSTKSAANDFPFLKIILKNNPEIHRKLRLTEDEVEFINQN
jgi:replication factor C large subunit